jgi:hypothetical protein
VIAAARDCPPEVSKFHPTPTFESSVEDEDEDEDEDDRLPNSEPQTRTPKRANGKRRTVNGEW